ncbi:TPA: hypothetical protein GRR63_23330 [Vibrio parahaemolyticus]|nr:hypothetical protein [Vibrio parahaemolyticus]
MSLDVEVVGKITEFVTVGAVVASTIAGFLSAFASKAGSKKSKLKNVNDSNLHIASRLVDVRKELARQKGIAKWQGMSATLLTVSQYVVGGVLTTSFIQDMLSSQNVGFLGLLVLISSLIHQHFRPDLKARFAKERIALLSGLQRDIEDEIYMINENAESASSVFDLRARVSKALKETEQSELQDTGRIDSETST